MPLSLDTIRVALEELLDAGPIDVVAGGARPVRRLGLALDAPDPAALAGLDALVLHRSRHFTPPPGLGVLGCHDPFDERLGLAHNPWLHERLGLADARALAPKASVHTAPPDLADRVTALFGGREGLHRGAGEQVDRAVLADALRADLVAAADDAGAQLYITGTWRVPAAAAIEATGLSVLLVGHARQERWSLELLAELLRQSFPATGLDIRT